MSSPHGYAFIGKFTLFDFYATITDPKGEYMIAGIPAGDYYVKVDRMPYSTIYYGNTTELSYATLISVGETGNFSVTGFNVQMIPMSANAVEG